MKKIKKLSLVLLSLVMISLAACNSGGGVGGAQTNTSRATTNIKSLQYDLNDSITGKLGVIGFVLTSKGNLNYYEDDRFVKTVWKFEDTVDRVKIAKVGNGRDDPTIVYVSTHVTGKLMRHNRNGEIHRCSITTIAVDCETIDKFEHIIYDFALDGHGDGYVLARTENLDAIVYQYANNQLVANRGHFKRHGGKIEIYDGQLYNLTSNLVEVYDFNNETMRTIREVPDSYDFNKSVVDKDLNGYGYNIKHELYKISNGHRDEPSLHKFEDIVVELSSIGSAVYAITSGKELKKCDINGDCSTIDTFALDPVSVAFKSEVTPREYQVAGLRGTIGVVVTNEGNLDYYLNDKFLKKIWKFEDTPKQVQIAQVGNGSDKPTIVYASTNVNNMSKIKHDRDGEIHLCTITSSETNCQTIDTFKNGVISFYFDEHGDGYTLSSSGHPSDCNVSKYINNHLVASKGGYTCDYQTMEIYDGKLYFLSTSKIGIYDFNDGTIHTVRDVDNGNIYTYSLDKDLYGYGYNSGSDNSLYRISNGYKEQSPLHRFKYKVNGISSIGAAIYVVTAGKELQRCDTAGNCPTIDTFGSDPVSVSFRAY